MEMNPFVSLAVFLKTSSFQFTFGYTYGSEPSRNFWISSNV